MELNGRKYSLLTYLKFILPSSFGVFAFFINFALPEFEYEIFGYAVLIPARCTFLVDHCAKIIQATFLPIMPYVVLLFGVIGVVDLYIRRKKHFKTLVQTLFSIFKIIGLILLIMIVFKIGPSILQDERVGVFVLNKILISICISIPVAAFFLPLLLDYGLVDFIGVLMRPIMRPLFKLPGRAAVITISAFLGNFSIGHIAVNEQYKTGKMTQKESAIIATSLSTVSIGFLMVLAQNTGIMEYWNLYFWSAFLITLLVTIIGIRIRPLKGLNDTYYEKVQANPEQVFDEKIFSNALNIALKVAENSEPLFKRILFLMKETVLILGTVASGTAFFGPLGVLLTLYTPLFKIIGYIFYPLIRLVGIPQSEAVTVATGAAVSFLEVTLPALAVAVGEWSMRTRYMLAVIPVSSIIFLASFVPCLMATEIPIKFSQILVIWFERMVLSILITGIFGLIFF